MSYVPSKIERRSKLTVSEGYLATGEKGVAHLARHGRHYTLGVRIDGSSNPAVHGTRLTRRQFSALWPATAGSRTGKLRSTFITDRWQISVDRYTEELAGLCLADVEPIGLDGDAPDVRTFEPPLWLGPEVTADPLFTDQNLLSLTAEKAQAAFGPLLSPPAPAVGAVPFLEVKGEIKLVLITAKSKARWIFPKGTPEPKLSDKELALVEAGEEAGAAGRLVGHAHDIYYWRGYRCSRIRYFPMIVEKLSDEWEERSQRERRICGLSEAIELVADRSFAGMIETFWRELAPRLQQLAGKR